MNKPSFFESVAHHNLERFHSECISWAFNSSEKMLHDFIKKVAKPDYILDITDAEVHCERYNTDILVSYKMGDSHHFIHIENKIKANEHFIAVNPEKVEKKYSGITKNTKLSQTQFYLIRNKAEIEKEFNAGEKVKWQYLSWCLPSAMKGKKIFGMIPERKRISGRPYPIGILSRVCQCLRVIRYLMTIETILKVNF